MSSEFWAPRTCSKCHKFKLTSPWMEENLKKQIGNLVDVYKWVCRCPKKKRSKK